MAAPGPGRARALTQAGDGCETKEWERRRRARLAQVREQSKDIAKTVRERATRERLRQLGRIEKSKKEDYIERQERLVERLEKLHATNLLAVGTGHGDAADVTEREKLSVKPRDKSKPRGRLAAKVLHKSQEDEFHKKKELLDRKLTARTLANARSRLKLSEAACKDLSQEIGSGDTVTDNLLDVTINSNANGSVSVQRSVVPNAVHNHPTTDTVQVVTQEAAPEKRDMETQWSVNGLVEWIPSTVISDKAAHETGTENKSNEPPSVRIYTNTGRRKDLFAVSDDMPTSLCGDSHRASSAEAQNKPSLSIVSEFLRTRDDRLPKPKSGFHKVSSEELHGIRDTLLRTRPIGGTEGICRVVDDQAIAGPTWQAVPNCGFCTFDHLEPSIGASMINRNISSVKPNRVRSRSVVNEYPRRPPNSWNRWSSPPRPPTNDPKPPQNSPAKGVTSKVSKSGTSASSVNPLIKKHSVMQYDHVTKSTKEVPLENDKFVAKIMDQDDDAYSLALKESEITLTNASKKEKENIEKQRSKVAVSKQKVAQEYRDTMAFLQTLSKDNDKTKPIESAYMDDFHQQKRRETHQRKLQNQFEQIQRESKLKAAECVASSRAARSQPTQFHKHSPNKWRKPASPVNLPSEYEDVTQVARTSLTDAQALLHQIRHTIPHRDDSLDKVPQSNAMKKSKGFVNSVKFDFVPNSYNYTSNVKHTPPTRERPSRKDRDLQKENDSIIYANEGEREVSVNVVNYEEHIDAAEYNSDTLVSDCSSDYDLIIQRHNRPKSKSSKDDVRKFIVYKLKGSSDEEAISKKIKMKSKLTNQTKAKDKNGSNKEVIGDVLEEECRVRNSKSPEKKDEKRKELDGVSEANREEPGEVLICQNKCQDREAQTWTRAQKPPQWDIDFQSSKRKIETGSGAERSECKCCHKQACNIGIQPTVSTTTSAATFRTATSDKSSTCCTTTGGGGYVKVLDDMGEEAGKFYIGASGFPQDDAYEVIIQLKRRAGLDNQEKGIQSSPISPKLVEEIKQLASQISSQMKQERVTCPTDQIAGELMKIAVQMCQNAKPAVKATTPLPRNVCEFSSSSSTVYMSPPERILPRFLQDEYLIPTDVVLQSPGMNETSKEQIMTYISAKKMVCRHQPNSEICSRESRGTNTRRKACTRSPRRPTSVSSTSSPSRRSPKICCCSECSRQPPERPKVPNACKKLATSSKHECKYCKQARVIKNKKQVYNVLVDSRENKPEAHKPKVHKTNLSPLVQKYINELLEMSKDGLKSVEVATLQCSTVSTPGSSVINMTSNVDTKSSHEVKMRQKIKDIITANISQQKECANCKTGPKSSERHKRQDSSNKVPPNTETSSDSPSTEKGLGDNLKLPQNLRRSKSKPLYRHKIKSLNISKNILKYFKTVNSEERKKSMYFVQSPRCTSSDTGQRYCDIQRRMKLKKYHYKTRSRSSPANNRDGHIDIPKASLTKERQQSDMGQKTKEIKDKIILPRKTMSAPATQFETKTENNPQTPTKETVAKERKSNVRTETVIHSEEEKPKAKPCTKRTTIKHSPPVRDENCRKINNINIPITSSTQTQQNLNSDDQLMQIAEGKLQNMEKIADLTEKCTKRLSNLAKVLDEVRKNKSNMYNQISSADTSFSENSSGKNTCSLKSKSETEKINTVHRKDKVSTPPEKNESSEKSKDLSTMPDVSDYLESESLKKQEKGFLKYDDRISTSKQDLEFVPILGDIPKPTPSSVSSSNIHSYRMAVPNRTSDMGYTISSHSEETLKTKSKPPPALFRVNLKSEEALIPHELSTVLEVDSPMSTRNASSRIKNKSPININVIISEEVDQPIETTAEDPQLITTTPMIPHPQLLSQQDSRVNEDITLQRGTNFKPVNLANKFVVETADTTTEAELRNAYINELQTSLLSPLSVPQQETSMNNSENAKLKMIDMNKFNEIMLKPFISIEEYARQYNIALLDEGSNLEDVSIKKPNDEEISSLNSDGTLPDIIAELLKRNVISEPFNFGGDPHAESNALSSDSNSAFALPKPKRHKKKVSINTKTIKNDDVDTSLSLSFASKADLERAFEELGIGWASSTLKKTKETLALSSSTSTMSSMEHPKYRKFKKLERANKLQQLPAMVSDTSETRSVNVDAASTSDSLHNGSEDKENKSSKHSVELQTSFQFEQPTTVKEFLANSLAGKITFQSKKSPWKEEEEHYSSLYSTKLSIDTSNAQLVDKRASSELALKHNNSKQNARHRTSTPVQLFKSLTFNSSTSSYNHSNNGLFGNVDDLSSVKATSTSNKNSTSTDKDELTIPNYSLKFKKSNSSSNSDS